ncbi:TonB-dependent receptor [Mucilaginibacter terrenus]|uniref:TonB-dependent receptor n=1 Tax=Mucilaginibacter terrenus TaxID=2482727 RepID=A0A3E2NTS4_9SPHI|nr:TonB-dependent receptor [Mucilaginibacter terrenus]RFZ84413.1 TonB-dependent receptor [Mucilaginibacter terrenus]
MRKILRIALLFAFFFVCAKGMAQTGSTVVTGTVSDDKGVTLPGVTVAVKDAQANAITDINGKYSINVPATGRVLVYSFIGMERQEITIGGRTSINVTLKSGTTSLSDVNVVAIGYGTQRRQDVNGAVSSVKASDIANIPQSSVDQLLQGKAAGVTVTQNTGAPGSQTSVHIRGISSFGAAEPLYVIDGVPISGSAGANGGVALNANNGQNSPSPLALLNPSDIESIDILKDASAAAIYGNRASNGVIIITTKKGRSGTSRISYDGYAGFQQPQKYLDLMKLPQYASLQNSLADVYGTGRRGEFADPTLLGPGTDWQRAIFRTAYQQSHQLSLSGGKEGINYYVSGGYFDQDGIAIGSNFKRYSFRSNIDAQIKDWFRAGLTLSGSRSTENIVYSDNGGIIYNALLQAPDVAVYNADGTFAGPPNTPDAVGGILNPVQQALSISNLLNRNNLNGNFYAEIRFAPGLTARTEAGGDFGFSNNNLFNPSYSYGRFSNPTATLQEQQNTNSFYNVKEYITYNHTFAQKHALTALLGYELSSSRWGYTRGTISGFLTNDLGGNVPTLNLGTATTAVVDERKSAPHNLESQFARGIYTFNNKYSVTATIRTDVSSNFAPGHQRGYFPSFAASWRLSDESFMAPIKSVADNIKIRLGYGQLGNEGIAPYSFGSQLNPTITGLGTGFLVARIANPDLTWQHQIEYNAGIDFSLFNYRIDGSFDYFHRKASKFLFQLPLPSYLVGGPDYLGGIAPPYVNAGGIVNKGFDLSLNSHNITGKDFKWNTTLIVSRYKNEVISLANGLPQLIQSVTNGFLSLPITRTVVGGPLGEFYGYRVKGVFKTDEQLRNAPIQFGYPVSNDPNLGNKRTWLGDVQYEDINGDGKVDANDQESLGSPQPNFTFGFTNTFNYKAFDVSIFLQGQQGGKILSLLDRTLGGLANLYQNQYAAEANFWSPTNPTSDIPAPRGGTDNANLQISDRFIHSATYLRVQNVQLGYNFPSKIIRKVKLNRLRMYVSGQNLYTFTGYKGYDPEIGLQNQNPLLSNVDIGRYPSARTVTFGINAEF